MNAKELEKAQNEISDAIYARAKELGFDKAPITDGVCDFEAWGIALVVPGRGLLGGGVAYLGHLPLERQQ